VEFVQYNSDCYKNYLSRCKRDFKRNPKLPFSFVNSKRKSNCFPPSLFLNNNVASNDNDICNLFAYFFQSTYTKCNSVINKDYPYTLPHLNSIFKPVIDVSDVLQSLNTLKLSFSPGLDSIPSCILRNCSSYLALPLTLIINLSLSQCRFPSIRKESFIIPLFK